MARVFHPRTPGRVVRAGGLALVLLGCGGSKQPPPGGMTRSPPATPDSTVSGVVVHEWEHWPLAGRVVEISGKRAVTDEAGRFSIEDVAATYDAFVSDEDGSWVSLYRGMSRRDPVFSHRALDYKTMGRERHAAQLFVKVEGGTWPLDRDSLVIQVRGPAMKLETLRGGSDGAETGPIRVGWDGGPKLQAELVVLRRYYPNKSYAELAPGELLQPAAMARVPLQLEAGREARVTVTLAATPVLRVRGTWGGRIAQAPPVGSDLYRDYRWIFGKYGSVIYGPLVSRDGAFDYGIVGLEPGPANEPRTLCLRVHDTKAMAQRCGVGPNDTVLLSLDDPPRLLVPSISPEAAKAASARRERSFGPPLTDRSEFSWEAAPGVNRLRVEAESSLPATPSFDVYTVESHAKASDFVRRTRLSRSEAEYKVSLTHFASFGSLDRAFAPDGLGARATKELFFSRSDEVPVLTVPAPPEGAVMPEVNVPPGMVTERSVPWAPCQHPPGTEIACGGGSWFSLAAINNKLRHYPELAFGIGIHCVTDCASAVAFLDAQEAYTKTHPNYGGMEPLDLPMPAPHPPPPPPPAPSGRKKK